MSEIVIVKNRDLLRGSIISMLEEKLSLQKITCYSEAEIQLLYFTAKLPDILIVDLDTNINHKKLINAYLKKDVKIIVWTSNVEESYLIEYFKLGLHGYFYSEMEIEELTYAIRSIIDGFYYTHPCLSHIIIRGYSDLINKKAIRPEGLLTNREWDVLELIAQGYRNGPIAKSLYIAEDTVTNHVTSIFRKLGVPDRTNAALVAIKNNWIKI